MSAAVGLLTLVSVFLVVPPAGLARLALLDGVPADASRTRKLPDWMTGTRAQVLACPAGCVAVGEAVHGTVGAVVGLVAGIALARWISRLEPPHLARARRETAQALPLAVDLLGACLSAGSPVPVAVDVVAAAVRGPLADRLRAVLARLEIGADPVTAWRLLDKDPVLASLARTMIRALESGAPIAAGLGRLGEDVRCRHRADRQREARSVGVRAAGPLAVCFLPAFMLIGVVPTVVAAFQHLGW
jgi:Flp pilus assembly protein TadB